MKRYETRQVLAAAYRGRAFDQRPRNLTHVVELRDVMTEHEAEEVLCKRIEVESLVDVFGHTAAELADVATCPSCRARDPRVRD